MNGKVVFLKPAEVPYYILTSSEGKGDKYDVLLGNAIISSPLLGA